MTRFRPFEIVMALCLALVVSACGRAGPLEPPPASATATTAAPAEDVKDRPFVLDGLLR